MSIKKILLSSVLLAPLILNAQQAGESIPIYPQNYFRNPLSIPILLAGNFGECRPNHFHSGIDIKTNGKENLPVYAAAEGYVSRIKMEKGGFGHALYITHPEGFTTLYAHLNNFAAPLQAYLKKVQYDKESWNVDITLRPEQFPVKKGQQIAWSGNTGASTAPHLHFEIRDSQTEHPLNPMLFGFPITDNRSSIPVQLSLYDMNQSIYDQQARIINLKKKGRVYSTQSDTIKISTDKLGIGIHANDYMDGSNNTLNFYTAKWYKDDSLQGSIRLDDIGYEETRYLHAYVDYKSRKQKGQWYQLLFRLPGNMLEHIYPFLNQDKGILSFKDTLTHTIMIELKDATGNDTKVSFYARAEAAATSHDCKKPFKVNNPNRLELPNIKFNLGITDLYDNLCFRFDSKADEQSLSDRYQIHEPYVPIHTYFELSIKPNKPIPFTQRNKVILVYSDGKTEDAKVATFDNGWYKASVRNFGTYWLATDTVAPDIRPLQKEKANLAAAKKISILVTEKMTSIKSFRATLDGKWLCFEPRGNLFFYTFDEHCPKGNHKLIITASDENDNSKTFVYNFTR